MTYGNGDTMRYVYDEYDRVIQVNYNEASNSQYRSTYGADGSVARTDDTLNRLSNYYTNDSTGRLLRMVVKDTGSINNGYDASYEYGYDRNNNIRTVQGLFWGRGIQTHSPALDSPEKHLIYGLLSVYSLHFFDHPSRISERSEIPLKNTLFPRSRNYGRIKKQNEK